MWQGMQFTAVYINSEIRWGFTLLQLKCTFCKTNWFPLPLPFSKELTKISYKKHLQNFETWLKREPLSKNLELSKKVKSFLLQPTLNGGATSTTPSPLTKSMGIFLLVDCEEGKKSLHLQNIHFNHKNTSETTPTNTQCSGKLKRSKQLTPSLYISSVLS